MSGRDRRAPWFGSRRWPSYARIMEEAEAESRARAIREGYGADATFRRRGLACKACGVTASFLLNGRCEGCSPPSPPFVAVRAPDESGEYRVATTFQIATVRVHIETEPLAWHTHNAETNACDCWGTPCDCGCHAV